MRLTHKARSTAALLALVGMLVMQLAVAGYACPGLQGADQGAMTFAQLQPDSGSMPGCDQPDAKQPALCHAHCQDAKQSIDKAELPSIPPALVVGFFFIVVANPAAFQRQPAIPPTLLTRTTAPPLSIWNCCFQI